MSTKTYRYQSEYAQQIRAEGEAAGEARGEARGEAKALLLILHGRGIPVSPEARERITDCTDTTVLEQWLDRALTATTTDDLFA